MAAAYPTPTLLLRERIAEGIRAFFKGQGFHEVETPLLVAHPGMEPHLEPFETMLRTARGASARAFLTTSPEYAMKKLLAVGLPRIFQLCKAFRNREDVSATHNPEFTMLEWYRAEADYTALMDDCDALLRAVGGDRITYRGEEIDLARGAERITVRDAFARYAGADADRLAVHESEFHRVFLNDVEPQLRHTILYEYPPEMAALARVVDGRAERFELYVGGLELANAFSELTDPIEQRRRLVAERAERRASGRVLYDLDEDFLRALERVPPSAGIALGVDRLVMLLADAPSIRDVLWFPADEVFRGI